MSTRTGQLQSGLEGLSTWEISGTADDAVLWVAADRDGVARSVDGGQSFSLVSNGLPATERFRRLVAHPSDPLVAWVGHGSFAPPAILYKTVDGGANWTPSDTGLAGLGVEEIAISPADPSTLYVGETGSVPVSKSVDGGATWTPSDAGLPAGTQPLTLAFDPTNVDRLVLGGRREVYLSEDAGASWTQIADAGDLRGKDSKALLLAGSELTLANEAGIQRSADGGATWALSNSGLAAHPPTMVLVHPEGPEVAFMVEPADGPYRTLDGGASWERVGGTIPYSGGGDLRPLALHGAAPAQLYLAGAEGSGVFRSQDGGTTWSGAGEPCTLGTITVAVSPADPETGVAVCFSGTGLLETIYRTDDGGASWDPIFDLPAPYDYFFPSDALASQLSPSSSLTHRS